MPVVKDTLVRHPYLTDRLRVSVGDLGESRTKQGFRDECDINVIMKRYERDGIVQHLNRYGGDYGNFVYVQDYQTSLNQVLEAREMFDSLPASVRSRFANDAGAFLRFATDEANRDELRRMGLLKAEQPAQAAAEAVEGSPGSADPGDPPAA